MSRGDPATRLDNQGNWATARNPALGSPSPKRPVFLIEGNEISSAVPVAGLDAGKN
jgi:hypothetical protein